MFGGGVARRAKGGRSSNPLPSSWVLVCIAHSRGRRIVTTPFAVTPVTNGTPSSFVIGTQLEFLIHDRTSVPRTSGVREFSTTRRLSRGPEGGRNLHPLPNIRAGYLVFALEGTPLKFHSTEDSKEFEDWRLYLQKPK